MASAEPRVRIGAGSHTLEPRHGEALRLAFGLESERLKHELMKPNERLAAFLAAEALPSAFAVRFVSKRTP